MKISFVWAEDEAGWIGKNGQLPWHLPADLKHFKTVTDHHPIVMGARTFASIGRPLPNRPNIVVSHHPVIMDQVTTVANIDDLMNLIHKRYANQEEVCIIGGAGFFSQMLAHVNYLHRTIVVGNHHGDVKMIPLDYQRWQLIKKTPVYNPETGALSCYFEEWVLNKEKDGKVNERGSS